jgi:transcriptional regulator with XRE-family HTH domain
MSELKKIRELKNLTQEELAEKSGLSVRTIQRIEAGVQPKGYTLKALAVSLGISETDLRIPEIQIKKETEIDETPGIPEKEKPVNFTLVKLINLSSIPLAWFPVANVLPPLLIMLFTKEKSRIVRQIISLQIFLAIIFPVIFMITALFKPGHSVVLAVMVLLVLMNMYIILRNAYEIDRKETLYYKLNFSIL